jgi:uncharacterized protein with von Willebrand factor type A (vWA) domain
VTLPAAPPGHLADNVMHFARVLRRAGMPVGSDRVITALQALQVAGLASRQDFHAVLAACLLGCAEHRALFDQAFDLFWHPAELASPDPALPMPGAPPAAPSAAANRRLASALFPNPPSPAVEQLPAQQPPTVDGLSWTQRERLQQADFAGMTPDEWRQAQQLLARMKLIFEPRPTRRTRASSRPGRVDWRSTLGAMARHGGEVWDMRWRTRRTQPAPLVLLADISGSMSRYSRMLLHFAHALGQADAPVESFVFGTRLTRTTRLLRGRDPDWAVAEVVRAVQDWSGGTRITECLHGFNHHWSRRVLTGDATLLLVSDGLEHGDTGALTAEMDRLRRNCRQLIWLNPLLRFEGFEPRAAGIRAMLPYVDRFLPAHNLDSLAQLVDVLTGTTHPTPGARPGNAPAFRGETR